MTTKLNILLLLSIFCGYWPLRLRVLSDATGMEATLGVVLGTFSCWLVITIALVLGLRAGVFDWLSTDGGHPYMIVLGAYLLMLLLGATPVGIAMESHASIAGWGYGFAAVFGARLVAVAVPALLIGYLGWAINTEPPLREAVQVRVGFLASLALLALTASGVSVVALLRK